MSRIAVADDEVRLIADGAGTTWMGELADPEHRLHRHPDAVNEQITAGCQHCATAFGATEAVEAPGVPLRDEYHQHPRPRTLVDDGLQVLIL